MLHSGPFRPAADTDVLYRNRAPWLVPGIIPNDGVVILASAPKTGKTCFATALARAVARGEPFLGEPVIQTPVLWCAYEETPGERLLLHEGLTIDDPFLIAYPGGMPPIQTRPSKADRYGRRDLRDAEPPFPFDHAREVGARLIVIDCLHAAVAGAPLAENHVARAVMGSLRTWSAHLYMSVLVLHHLTKSNTRGWQPERFADSAQILAASSCHFFMDRYDELENELGKRCSPPLREGLGVGGADIEAKSSPSPASTELARTRAGEGPRVYVAEIEAKNSPSPASTEPARARAGEGPGVVVDTAGAKNSPSPASTEPARTRAGEGPGVGVTGKRKVNKDSLSLQGEGPAKLRARAIEAPTSRIILHGRGRHPAPVPRIELVSSGILDYRLADDRTDWIKPRRRTVPERILELLQEGWSLTADELAKRLQTGPGVIRNAVTQLKSAGQVVLAQRSDRGCRYAIAASEADDHNSHLLSAEM